MHPESQSKRRQRQKYLEGIDVSIGKDDMSHLNFHTFLLLVICIFFTRNFICMCHDHVKLLIQELKCARIALYFDFLYYPLSATYIDTLYLNMGVRLVFEQVAESNGSIEAIS